MAEKLVSIWQQNGLEGDPTISNSKKNAAEKEKARKKYVNMELQPQSVKQQSCCCDARKGSEKRMFNRNPSQELWSALGGL